MYALIRPFIHAVYFRSSCSTEPRAGGACCSWVVLQDFFSVLRRGLPGRCERDIARVSRTMLQKRGKFNYRGLVFNR